MARIAVGEEVACFFPPQGVQASVPLPGVVFMSHGLCWGALGKSERKRHLGRQLTAWRDLWGIEDFGFDTVFARAIRRRLPLDRTPEDTAALEQLPALASLCLLSGGRVKGAAPLVHERLGNSKALFPLCRLPVPCRGGGKDEVRWVPAYRAYLGEDWLGEGSVEHLLAALPGEAAGAMAPAYVIAPERLERELARLRTTPTQEELPPDEVVDEAAADADDYDQEDAPERETWLNFLRWIGVNTHLRPVGLLDAEDYGSWTATADLGGYDRGLGCLRQMSEGEWRRFRGRVEAGIRKQELTATHKTYFYKVYDLEHLAGLCELIRKNPEHDLAARLLRHLAWHWPRLQDLTEVVVAMPQSSRPNSRAKPPRAYEHEVHAVAEAPWVDCLRRWAWCPTSHGPNVPGAVWLPTQEVERRFRLGRDAPDMLLPALGQAHRRTLDHARGLARFLGIRGDLNRSTFRPEDCLAVFNYLERRFQGTERIPPRALREIINPAYRQAIDLMPPTRAEQETPMSRQWRARAAQLREAPLLVNDGEQYKFVPAHRALHAERRGSRARLGGLMPVWTFVLEGHNAAWAPLREYLGCQSLEQTLRAEPRVDESDLTEEDVAEIRRALDRLAPYLLCRVEADRSTEPQIRRDAAQLRRALEGLIPAGELTVKYALGGVETEPTPRTYHWERGDAQVPPRLIIRWGEEPWPPEEHVAEALAAGLCEAMQVNAFESFLALIRAQSGASRRRLLEQASAPLDLEGKASLLSSGDVSGDGQGAAEETIPPPPPRRTGEGEEADAEDPALGGRDGARAVTFHVLRDPDQLVFDGEGEVIRGKDKHGGDEGPGGGGRRGRGPGKGGRRLARLTDLTQLDEVGMTLAMRYERVRVRKTWPAAEIFDDEDPDTWADALVFDVSNPDRIKRARARCPTLAGVLQRLSSRDAFGLNAEWPGFDILTLLPQQQDAAPAGLVDRIIELKSSTVRARKQSMTWNEWKTASSSTLSRHFWLYLVCNLRADLRGVLPYLQMVQDPFKSIRSREVTEVSVKHKVDVYTTFFDEAVRVGLKPRPEAGPPSGDDAS